MACGGPPAFMGSARGAGVAVGGDPGRVAKGREECRAHSRGRGADRGRRIPDRWAVRRGRTRSTAAIPARKTPAGTTTAARIQNSVTPHGRPTLLGHHRRRVPRHRRSSHCGADTPWEVSTWKTGSRTGEVPTLPTVRTSVRFAGAPNQVSRPSEPSSRVSVSTDRRPPGACAGTAPRRPSSRPCRRCWRRSRCRRVARRRRTRSISRVRGRQPPPLTVTEPPIPASDAESRTLGRSAAEPAPTPAGSSNASAATSTAHRVRPFMSTPPSTPRRHGQAQGVDTGRRRWFRRLG